MEIHSKLNLKVIFSLIMDKKQKIRKWIALNDKIKEEEKIKIRNLKNKIKKKKIEKLKIWN